MSNCEHRDVRYFKDDKGAIACVVCGRLFGHLHGVTFTAFNPIRERTEQWCPAEVERALDGKAAYPKETP